MDRKPNGPLKEMFYTMADQLATRLQHTGCGVKVEHDPLTMTYRATVTTPAGATGVGSDWSPLAAIEQAYHATRLTAAQKETGES